MLTEDAKRFADPVTGKLELEAVLDGLLIDGLIEESNSSLLRSIAKPEKNSQSGGASPLERIAAGGWTNAHDPTQKIDLDFLTRWLAKKVGLEWLRIDPLQTDVPAVTAVMSHAYASRFNIICVDVTPEYVVFGTAEPFYNEWQSELQRVLRKEIRLVICNPVDIRRYLHELYSVSRSVLGAKKDQGYQSSAVQNLEQLMDLGRTGKLEANDSHVISIVDWLLQYAYEQRASDIHLEPRRETGAVRFRIDGVMQQVYDMPAAVMSAVTSRLKILGRLDVAEKRRPQDGRLKTRNSEGKEVELRISTMPTAFGEKMVMRIFDPEVLVKDQSQLGFDRREADIWNTMIKQPNGILLVTGPTGSGKTTTLYSSLQMLATPEVNVCTIEDPIELVVPAFNQMQVQHNIELDFAAGVRTLLRQDPDIIMVGEIRDLETAQMAVQAALTGHLVLSTLHTNDAASAVTRLLELGIPYYLIRSTLIGVVAQRLIRTYCPVCATKVPMDEEQWTSLMAPWKAQVPESMHTPTGCLECRNTGFLGRAGIYELLQMTPGVKNLITADVHLEDLRKQAYKDGMRPMRISGLAKVGQGKTSFAEVLKVTPSPLIR
ncbi:GspE/PulE family protein [Granulosicoccus antarcticus]|uniref:GspE/PulE family protein n=1 Tax=Granulosicoccus antarcticus TaxID=437505 RepID=UPI000B5A9FB4|nr:GspE/PulE family protein [Granulosicoccus antarcticus]